MYQLEDFGLARTQQEDSDHSSETIVVRTLGYVAPEYAESGKAYKRTDVYSFGVVLLQLITGLENRQGTKREKPSRVGNNHVTCLLLIIKFLVPNSILQKRPLLKHNKIQADEKLKVSHMFYKAQSYN